MARTRKSPPEPRIRLTPSAAAFGAAIKSRRAESRGTLREVAGLSGVGVRFLLELEHGKSTAALGKALQVAERLGLEVWLVPRALRPPGLTP